MKITISRANVFYELRLNNFANAVIIEGEFAKFYINKPSVSLFFRI